jgi:hypothetical protein
VGREGAARAGCVRSACHCSTPLPFADSGGYSMVSLPSMPASRWPGTLQ